MNWRTGIDIMVWGVVLDPKKSEVGASGVRFVILERPYCVEGGAELVCYVCCRMFGVLCTRIPMWPGLVSTAVGRHCTHRGANVIPGGRRSR